MTCREKLKEHKLAMEQTLVFEMNFWHWHRNRKRGIGLFLTPAQLEEIENYDLVSEPKT
jgi:hypothetical protein